MRIAMIGQKRTGSREGGVEVVVGELARRMADLGHQVTCYDRMGEGAPSEPYEKDGYRIGPVKALDIKGLSALTSSFAATRAAIKDGADVIHYHAEGPCVPLRFARSADIRTVATIHGLDWQRAKWGGLASKYIKFGEATAAKCADALIVLSRGNQEYFKEAYGREATLIPNGITPEADLPAKEISERLGLTQGSYVLYLGRIVPEKRPELLVEAYKQVKTDKRLVIAGDSSDTDDYAVALKEAAASDPRALFTGHVEGLPMSLLEAMSHGAACVTSDIPECADVLQGCGLTFPHGDAGALRDVLEGLIADSAQAERLGAMARDRAINGYDWNSVVQRTLALYEGVA